MKLVLYCTVKFNEDVVGGKLLGNLENGQSTAINYNMDMDLDLTPTDVVRGGNETVDNNENGDEPEDGNEIQQGEAGSWV